MAHWFHIVPFEGVAPAKRALYLAAERLAARQTDVFIGVSEAVGRAYVTAGIARRGRVACAPPLPVTKSESDGRHDNYGFALSAQPGESQRRPTTNSSSRLIV